MRKLISAILAVALGLIVLSACNNKRNKEMDNSKEGFVTVRDGKFMLDGKEYRYIGANFWYGAILGDRKSVV